MKMMDRPRRWRNSASSFSTCACTETSSAETASSATSTSGRNASARASPMRWRWPPENSCGKRSLADGSSPTRANSSLASAMRLRPRRAVHDRALCHQFGRLAARIERSERILKHHLDMPGFAANLFARHLCPVLAFEDDRSGIGIDQPNDAAGERGFARAGFADDAQRRAARQFQRDILYRVA